MEATLKAWVIVYRHIDNNLELLLLKPNPEPGLNYDYYVITGGVENNETPKQAAVRETEEEIGAKPQITLDLQIQMKYSYGNPSKDVVEVCFAIKIDDSELILNEEHIGYKWVSIDEFEKEIWWEGPRDQL